jgi:hypothetical protein
LCLQSGGFAQAKWYKSRWNQIRDRAHPPLEMSTVDQEFPHGLRYRDLLIGRMRYSMTQQICTRLTASSGGLSAAVRECKATVRDALMEDGNAAVTVKKNARPPVFTGLAFDDCVGAVAIGMANATA